MNPSDFIWGQRDSKFVPPSKDSDESALPVARRVRGKHNEMRNDEVMGDLPPHLTARFRFPIRKTFSKNATQSSMPAEPYSIQEER